MYIVDSLTSLRLCVTTGLLKEFKKVYLLNYREELSDEEILKYSEDVTGKWIGTREELKDKPKHGFEKEVRELCLKVLLEESITSLETELPQEVRINRALNKFLKSE